MSEGDAPAVLPEVGESRTLRYEFEHGVPYAKTLREASTETVRVVIEARPSEDDEWTEMRTWWEGEPEYGPAGRLDIPYPSQRELVLLGRKWGMRFVKATILANLG